jgi:hypothetical protein
MEEMEEDASVAAPEEERVGMAEEMALAGALLDEVSE